MSEMKLRVSRAIDDVLVKAGIGFVDENLSDALSTAAIEAMREPTEDMPFPEAIKQYWRAMIDEALK